MFILLFNWVLFKVDCFLIGLCLIVNLLKVMFGINIGKEGWFDNFLKVDVDGVSFLCIFINLLLFS